MTRGRPPLFLFWRAAFYYLYAIVSLMQISRIHSYRNPAFLCTSGSCLEGRNKQNLVASSPLFAAVKGRTSSTETTEANQKRELRPQQHRHAIFQQTNAVSRSFPTPESNTWRKFVTASSLQEHKSDRNNNSSPPSLFLNRILSITTQHKVNLRNRNQLVNDVTVRFDDPVAGAKELVKKCQLFPEHNDVNDDYEKEATIQHLTNILSYFQSIAFSSNDNESRICQARVVSSIGRTGMKCPRWHADHVPVRLVMSLIGPGCEYIPHEVEVLPIISGSQRGSNERRLVDRHALNNLDEDNTDIANDIILPPGYTDEAVIKKAEEGEAVLLMGRAWEDSISSDDDLKNPNNVLATVHRSPMLSPGQERILLTVDLVPP